MPQGSSRLSSPLKSLSRAYGNAAVSPTFLRNISWVTAGILTFASATQVMVIKLSQNEPSALSHDHTVSPYPYHFTSIPLLSDMLKLAISAFLLFRETPEQRKMTKDWWSMRLYIIPAVCYFLHNNLLFMVLADVSPWTYMILANLKIATTAVMFRTLLGRKLTKLQWQALGLLVFGTLISQIDDCSRHGILAISYRTLAKGLLLGFFSAMAGTYTEMFLRANDDSLYWQNCQMYGFGMLCNCVNVLVLGYMGGSGEFPLLPQVLTRGFNTYAWLAVLVLAIAGMLVAWIMKYTKTIVKVYSNIMGMLVAMVASHVILGMKISLPTLLGYATVCTGSALYYLGVKELMGAEKAAELLGAHESPGSAPSHTRASTHPSLVEVEVSRFQSDKGT